MDRASKLNSTKATKEQTMSEMQKMAHIEYFKQGGGPLFPGMRYYSPKPIEASFPMRADR